MLKVAGSIASGGCTDLYCARGAQGVRPMMAGGNGQLIGSIVSDVIVRCWPCGRLDVEVAHWATLVALLQVVDNLLQNQW